MDKFVDAQKTLSNVTWIPHNFVDQWDVAGENKEQHRLLGGQLGEAEVMLVPLFSSAETQVFPGRQSLYNHLGYINMRIMWSQCRCVYIDIRIILCILYMLSLHGASVIDFGIAWPCQSFNVTVYTFFSDTEKNLIFLCSWIYVYIYIYTPEVNNH